MKTNQEERIKKQWEQLKELIMDFCRGDADFEEIMLSFKVWARQNTKDTLEEYNTFLIHEGYADDDLWCECDKESAIHQFLNKLDEKND